MKLSTLIVSLSLVLLSAPMFETATPAVELACLVNAARAKKGLSPLGLDPKLTNAAQKHAEWMGQNSNLSHTGNGGSSPSKRVSAAGYNWSDTAENVAYGSSDAAGTNKQFTNSPGHFTNMVGSYTHIGVGVFKNSKGQTYWAQSFGKNGSPATNIPNCSGSGGSGGSGGGSQGSTPTTPSKGPTTPSTNQPPQSGKPQYGGGSNKPSPTQSNGGMGNRHHGPKRGKSGKGGSYGY